MRQHLGHAGIGHSFDLGLRRTLRLGDGAECAAWYRGAADHDTERRDEYQDYSARFASAAHSNLLDSMI